MILRDLFEFGAIAPHGEPIASRHLLDADAGCNGKLRYVVCDFLLVNGPEVKL